MKIGDNVKVKYKFYYDLFHAPYVGQSGVIIEENATRKPMRYRVKFPDSKKLWWYEGELETDDQAQKEQCVKDCLENEDETKQHFLRAALTLWLWRLNYESAKA